MLSICKIGEYEDLETLDNCVKSIYNDIERLRENPKLFPSQRISSNFWAGVKTALNDTMKLSVGFRQLNLRYKTIFARLEHEDRLDHTRLRRDQSRKPWEQFLHNNAPGSGVDLRDMEQGGSIQILPMAALRLLHTVKENQTAIIRAMEAVRSRSMQMQLIQLLTL